VVQDSVQSIAKRVRTIVPTRAGLLNLGLVKTLVVSNHHWSMNVFSGSVDQKPIKKTCEFSSAHVG